MLKRLTALALLLTSPLAAQNPLGVFADLAGEWEGDAWIIMGPDGRHEVQQREWIRPVAGGTVITVQGIGVERMEDGTKKTVHDAFALIHLDHDGTTPVMRAFTAAGRWMDMDLTVRKDGYDWGMTDPRAGQIRYEARLDERGQWTEKGYMSRDEGTTWNQFFEMTLRRVADR